MKKPKFTKENESESPSKTQNDGMMRLVTTYSCLTKLPIITPADGKNWIQATKNTPMTAHGRTVLRAALRMATLKCMVGVMKMIRSLIPNACMAMCMCVIIPLLMHRLKYKKCFRQLHHLM